jgi:hypothetical protein
LDTKPEIYLNRGLKTVFLTMLKDTPWLCAVDQLIHILSIEKAQTLVVISHEIDTSEKISMKLLQSSELKDRVTAKMHLA